MLPVLPLLFGRLMGYSMYGLVKSVQLSEVCAVKEEGARSRQQGGAIPAAGHPVRTADLALRMRRRRAPAAFERAYLELLLAGEEGSITVTDVIRASGYSRGSFYRYYADLLDLLEHVVASEVERYVALVADAVELGESASSEFERVLRVAYELLEHVAERTQFYRALFSPHVTCIDFEAFCRRAIERFRERVRMTLRERSEAIDEEFYYYCTTRSFLTYIKYWVERDFTPSKEQLALQIAVMSSADPSASRPSFVRRG